MKSFLGEFVGSAIFVLLAGGATIIGGSSFGIFGIAIGVGIALIIAYYLVGGISGAHLNPAVSISLALSGKFSWNKVFGYIISQIIGSLLGALILYSIFSNIPNGALIINSGFATNKILTSVSLLSAVIVELFMSIILCLAYLATTRISTSEESKPFIVGFALSIATLISLPFTLSGLNPAKSVALSLISRQNFNILWVFIIIPIIGAILAYIIHVFILGREHHHHENYNSDHNNTKRDDFKRF